MGVFHTTYIQAYVVWNTPIYSKRASVCHANWIVLSVEGIYCMTVLFWKQLLNEVRINNNPDFVQPLMAFHYSNICYSFLLKSFLFLPPFGLPGGRLTHPERPWLRHCQYSCSSIWNLKYAFSLICIGSSRSWCFLIINGRVPFISLTKAEGLLVYSFKTNTHAAPFSPDSKWMFYPLWWFFFIIIIISQVCW